MDKDKLVVDGKEISLPLHIPKEYKEENLVNINLEDTMDLLQIIKEAEYDDK